ncbi:serine hydrolase [Leucobacter sp. CSA2]|uniref:Serine hydrolase n=1 Tax=Leucobacter edaphi TaxID=2796472 RepID=A0A934QFI4_9MICO|nr:serine hydrolase [Leucobacter edaphi]MBK0422742.1 serine hydrolase [Leucobacter edaphi]
MVAHADGFSDSEFAEAFAALAATLLVGSTGPVDGGEAGDDSPGSAVRCDASSLPRAAIYALAPDGRALAAHRARERFYAASTIKLSIALAVLTAVDRGTIRLNDPLTSRDRFPSRGRDGGEFSLAGAEVDADFPAAGEQVTVRECLSRMIEFSSNEASNVLVGQIGFASIAEKLASLGLKDTQLTRLIGDAAAKEIGFTHETTAADLALLLARIVDGSVLRPSTTRTLLDMLRAQRFPAITQGLKAPADSGSKSGWDDGIRNDVAWFERAGRPPGANILAVGTEGFEPRAAVETIRAIARAVEFIAG